MMVSISERSDKQWVSTEFLQTVQDIFTKLFSNKDDTIKSTENELSDTCLSQDDETLPSQHNS